MESAASWHQFIGGKENIPPTLVATLKGLWESLIDEADQKTAAAVAVHEEKLADLKSSWKNIDPIISAAANVNQWGEEKTETDYWKSSAGAQVSTLEETNAAALRSI